MKKLQEIFQQESVSEIINDLKTKSVKLPEWADLEKDYEPINHKIMDKSIHPDKMIHDDNGNVIKTEPITRIAIGLQKLAVKRMSEFMFTLPANTILEDDDETFKDQYKALKKVLKKNRWDSLNKKRCKITSSECECAVYWYAVEGEKHRSYGFETKFKLRHAIFSPKNGDELYPLFDELGDMIAFSRKFEIINTEDKTEQYFETWTAEKYYKWAKTGIDAEWELIETLENPIKKIPIIYTYRPEPIWADADNGKVHEIEKLLSNNGDIIDYHSSPVLIIKGELKGAPKKREANKVFFAEQGGGAKYVSWQQSPESVKFQFETLLRLYFTELQLPDLSFENIKGLGAQSGEARKWMIVDAHLKVGDESEIYLDAINREYNLLKAFLSLMNTSWKNIIDMELEPEIRPFIIEDEKQRVDVLIAANGGKPLISHKLSVKQAGLSEDPDADYETIIEERQNDNTMDIFGTGI